MDFYATLVKPSWAPAPPVFGIVWSILYPIIIAAFGYVIFKVVRGEYPAALLVPVLINIVSNVAFTPIQFGLRNLWLAEADIVIVLVTIVWSMIAIWPHSRLASLALSPYLVWVTIATALQTSITLLNR
ncbi:MAG: tryptophan-rich sensory protein [Actinobacteria bacterium HGW-Actinobacteria-1]|jgi:tryptophan-rich sensory protein|nr:MAG: tryptophan-rich sensory protein [Actinobacteria bacterium HGW-Actinobacteria-1]